jgi:type I restriction enzyme S subunit
MMMKKKYLLKKDDVLFNRTNSAEWVGKTAKYKGERPAIFAGYLIRIINSDGSD